MSFETVIGLEVHAQLNTETKLFSKGSTVFGAEPNTQVTFVDAGFPGTLPVLNRHAVHLAIQFGLAVQATIQQNTYFERKNYVYPDLPKGYQISQYRHPLILNGHLDILSLNGQLKRVTISHAHLEEDAGKLLHKFQQTAVDLNRAGIPLLEIVTSPCLSNTTEVITYLKSLNQLLRFLNICNGNMQEGSFRCDVNISLKPIGSSVLGTRVELKNLNSYRFIEKAVLFEENRQRECLLAGQPIRQETRLFNEASMTTEPMRDKESTHDYRYFPDPDLMPIFISDALITRLSTQLPELPRAIEKRLEAEGLDQQDDRDYLLTSPAILAYYDAVRSITQASPKLLINWIKGPLTAALKDRQQSFENISLSPQLFSELLNQLTTERLSTSMAKNLLTQLLNGELDSIDALSDDHSAGLSEQEIQAIIEQTLQEYPLQVTQYQQGNSKVLSFLMGQTLKNLRDKPVDPKKIQAALIKKME